MWALSDRSVQARSALIAIAFLALGWLAGCDNFLTRTPANAVSSEEFYANEDQARQAVIGIYSQLQGVYHNQWRYTELRSDNTTHMWDEDNRGPHHNWEIDEYTSAPANPILQGMWGGIYEGIQRSNAFLNNVDGVEFSSPELENKLRGEARFLRALFYFDLVRLFGGVPLVTEQVQSTSEAFATLESRASVDSVYQQIIRDAEQAAQLLPRSNPGRATEGAARTLLGDVHMTRENYQQAVDQLRMVTDMNYGLLSDYSAIFDPANKGHQESVFTVQFAELQSARSLGSGFIYQFAPLGSGTEITGDNAGRPTGLNIPSRGIIEAYEEGDERKKASVSFYVDEGNSTHGIAMGDSIPYIEKYDVPHTVRGVTAADWPVYRYAEVLLMLSEALNELGQRGEAYQYINRIRERAGLSPLESGLSQSEFRDAVIHEQRVELAFENDRWFDLIRTDRAMEAMQEHAEVYRGIQPHWQEPAYVIEEFKFKYPIPQRALTLNPDLQQNPGW